jgi:hypothetical protein
MFSIIIPTFNRAALLPAALDSVLAQPGGDYEIIVVDDGSTDDTPAVLSRYASRVQVLTQPNRGPGPARNFAAESARGEYLMFLDSDDLWFPWTLNTIRRALEAHRTPALIVGKAVEFSSEAEIPRGAPEKYEDREFADYLATAASGLWIGTCGVAIRAEHFRKAGGFAAHGANAEDSDLWLRLGEARGLIQIESPPLFAYRRHAASAVADLGRTVTGMRHLLAQEKLARYPGASARQCERRTIITRHIRPASLALARAGEREAAWELYLETFSWHVRLGRWRYLVGFPLVALSASSRSHA